MDNETEICKRFEAELAEIARMDRAYYLNPTPTPADRTNYLARQHCLEQVRARLYSELRILRHADTSKSGTFWVQINDRITGQRVKSSPQCALSHDLANYLGVIIGRCDLLADFVSKDVDAERHLSSVRDAAQKMTERIHESTCHAQNLVDLSGCSF